MEQHQTGSKRTSVRVEKRRKLKSGPTKTKKTKTKNQEPKKQQRTNQEPTKNQQTYRKRAQMGNRPILACILSSVVQRRTQFEGTNRPPSSPPASPSSSSSALNRAARYQPDNSPLSLVRGSTMSHRNHNKVPTSTLSSSSSRAVNFNVPTQTSSFLALPFTPNTNLILNARQQRCT